MDSFARIRRAAASLSREQWWFIGWTLVAMGLLAWLAVPGPRAVKAAERLAAAHAAGQAGGTADYAAYWIPRGAKTGLLTGGLLLLGVRWLVRPLPGNPVSAVPAVPRRTAWGLAAFTAAVMGISGFLNAPRLEFGLWGDEESTMRKSVVGQYQRGKDGRLELDGVTWTETFFRYRDPNNHPLNSVLSRLSHTALARGLSDPAGFYFDARAMRLPVFAAGLLGLAALAWAGYVLGRPVAGGVAVALLAMHPWFVRYGSETRGYGLLLLFAPLALGTLARAAQTGKWRWWTACGLTQFLMLWSYPGALHLLVALNVSAVWLVLARPEKQPAKEGPGPVPRTMDPGKDTAAEWRKAQVGRWVTACALGGVLSLIMLLPLVQPLGYYLKSARMQGGLPSGWAADALSWLVSGLPWQPWDAGNPLCWSWRQTAAPWAAATALAAALLLGLAGWWRAGGVGRRLLPALVLHPFLFVAQSLMAGSFFYSWYLFPALAGGMLVLAGVALLPRIPALAAGVLFAVTVLPGQWRMDGLLRSHPVEQMREGTKLTRAVSLPSDPRIDEVMTVDIVMTTRGYDPAVLPLPEDDPAGFREYLQTADAAGKPLFVHFGSPGLAVSVRPKVMALVHDPALFEHVATLHGMDGPYTRQVYRYLPGTLPGTLSGKTAAP